jgi:predicted RNase H-like HicB family nuclease
MRVLLFNVGKTFRACVPSDPNAVASGATKEAALAGLAGALGEPTSTLPDDAFIEDFTSNPED